MITPDYIFETSWEVCNRVGGIYAVLSTRAASMMRMYNDGEDHVFFFGPDFGSHSDQRFREDKSLLPDWKRPKLVRVGRWMVPGKPVAILLKADSLWLKKDEIYGWAWERFGVRSHAAYGDYDESAMYGYAAGMVMESLYKYLGKSGKKTTNVCVHVNEWQTAFTLFYIKDHCPKIATLFTTHATGIGRSIAGNGKPLYDYFEGYNGDQMAQELNMVSKHSAEKMAAKWADCFTTVSDITARECKQLLDKPVDIVTPNGFEPDFVPKGRALTTARAKARKALTAVAEHLMGGKIPEDSIFCCIAGRYEMKNKGIDVFRHTMEVLGDRLYHDKGPFRGDIIAFAMIPYLDKPMARFGRVTLIYVPYYLNGTDPMFSMTYYDLLVGMDITVFPSYYEPWGYTPLESVAFHVPTVTTSLAGFGAWADGESGVTVVDRNDSNYWDVVQQCAQAVFGYAQMPAAEREKVRQDAWRLSRKAEWSEFFRFYKQAYQIALKNVKKKK